MKCLEEVAHSFVSDAKACKWFYLKFSLIIPACSSCAAKWLLIPHGRDNVGPQKGAELLWLTLKGGGRERAPPAPDYVKWPEFCDRPTLCGIRMLEKVTHTALKLEKLLRNESHPTGGNLVESNRFQGDLADSQQQKDIGSC